MNTACVEGIRGYIIYKQTLPYIYRHHLLGNYRLSREKAQLSSGWIDVFSVEVYVLWGLCVA